MTVLDMVKLKNNNVYVPFGASMHNYGGRWNIYRHTIHTKTMLKPSRTIYASPTNQARPQLINYFDKINCVFKARPVIFGSIFAMIKTFFADFFVQTYVENKTFDQISWHRSALFTLFGLFYCGGFTYFIFSKLYPTFYTNVKNTLLRSILLSITDIFGHCIFIYYPTFYAFKSLVYNGIDLQKCIDAIKLYFNENIYNDIPALMKIWIPGNIITFIFVPNHLRVPWLAFVSFVWTIVLSIMRGANEEMIEQ